MASVLSTKKWVGIFFSPFDFSDLEAHQHLFFFSTKECVSCPWAMARLQRRRSQLVEGREGRWLMEVSAPSKEIQAQGLTELSHAPLPKRGNEILFRMVFLLCPHSIFQKPCGRSVISLVLQPSLGLGLCEWPSQPCRYQRGRHRSEIQPATQPGRILEWLCGPKVPDSNHPPPLAASCAQCIEISADHVQSMPRPALVSVAKEESDWNQK